MWIQTQNKQRIINSDHIIDIFVSKTETRIIAETTKEDVIVIGEYKDRDTCLEILDVLMIIVSHDDVTWLQIPPKDEIESWLEDSHKMAEQLYN